MSTATEFPSDVAFTPIVKAVHSRKGSRRLYERMEKHGSWRTTVTPDLKAFIEKQRSVFLATASKDGQPTIQHRGGPAGFLRVIDEKTLAFVDFVGNQQYITLGNLSENPKAHLFLIDYAQLRRIKIWGEASVVENDRELTARLMPKDYKARPEQVLLFTVSAWDVNCPQHIPQRYEADDVDKLLTERDSRISELEDEVKQLREHAEQSTEVALRQPRKPRTISWSSKGTRANLALGRGRCFSYFCRFYS